MLLLCAALGPVQLKNQVGKLETSVEWTLDQTSRDFILISHYCASRYGLRKLLDWIISKFLEALLLISLMW